VPPPRLYLADGRTLNLNQKNPDQNNLMQAVIQCKDQIIQADLGHTEAKQKFLAAKEKSHRAQNNVSENKNAVRMLEAWLKKSQMMGKAGNYKSLRHHSSASSGRHISSSSAADTMEVAVKAASTRVADIMSAIRLTFEQRRREIELKRSHDAADAAAALSLSETSTVDDALHVSFRQKMDHRRLVTVLRPTRSSALEELEHMVEEHMQRKSSNQSKEAPTDANKKNEEFTKAKQEHLLKAEEMLLLALHPPAPDDGHLPSTPKDPTDGKASLWAEPGWHLNLDATTDDELFFRGTLLSKPCGTSPAFRAAHAACASAPGRQSAQLLPRQHLRILTAPLSDFSRASAPAQPSADVVVNEGTCCTSI
jgi:hypothetical protein